MGKLSTPKPPGPAQLGTAPTFDAAGAISQAGDANRAAAQATAQINRPDQETPYGKLTWTQGGNNFRQGEFDAATKAWQDAGGTGSAPTRESFGFDPNAWKSSIELDPRVQGLLDQDLNANSQLKYLLTGAAADFGSTIGKPMPGTGSVPMRALEAEARGRYNNFLPQVENAADAASQSRGMVFDALGRVSNLSGPDYSGVTAMPGADAGTRQAVENALYQRATSRLDPRFGQARSALESRLANQGITQGSEAYNTEMANFGQTQNDAYSSAMNDAIVGGGEEMQRLFGMGLASRQQGVSEANTLNDSDFRNASTYFNSALGANSQFDSSARSWQDLLDTQEGRKDQSALNRIGAVTNEQQRQFGNEASTRDMVLRAMLGAGSLNQGVPMPEFNQNSNVAAVEADPVLQALLGQFQGMQNNYGINAQNAWNTYNGQTGSRNGLLGGLANLAGSGMMAYAMMSDRRAKEKVNLLGRLANGLGVYSFHYKPEFQSWGHGEQIGVMADEVERIIPEAVIARNGYKLVNYGLI